MLDFGFYNMDCMEGMKDFPDNYFDLAIVDPPYGDGGGGGGGSRTTERDSVSDSTDTSNRDQGQNIPGRRPRRGLALNQPGGGTTLHVRTPEAKQQLREPAEHGPRSSEKNYSVGYSARGGLF